MGLGPIARTKAVAQFGRWGLLVPKTFNETFNDFFNNRTGRVR
jgi:hypothetical protein